MSNSSSNFVVPRIGRSSYSEPSNSGNGREPRRRGSGGKFLAVLVLVSLVTLTLVGAYVLFSGGSIKLFDDREERVAAAELAYKQACDNYQAAFERRAYGAELQNIEQELATAEEALGLLELPIPERPKANYRVWTAPTNPNFAAPLDFSYAVNKDLNFPASKERAASSSTGATTGILVDMDTRQVLWMKNPDSSVPIASMVKMMTMLVALEALENNHNLALNTPIQITDAATKVARTGVLYLDKREILPLDSLLKAITIRSSNDAAAQVAEFIGGGDEEKFIATLNQRASELGMNNTRYVSACGLPDKVRGDSKSSPHDLIFVAEQLLQYPLYMEWANTQYTEIDRPIAKEKKSQLSSTNRLVSPRWPGVDGLKTGFTNAAGSCLTVSCLRNGKRLVGVVTGYKSGTERDRFCRMLLDWGYQQSANIAEGKVPAAR